MLVGLKSVMVSRTTGLYGLKFAKFICFGGWFSDLILYNWSVPLQLKMATGTYLTGSAHPYPYPQNFTRRVTRTRMRVKK
jgi:hypothetical protein